MADFKINEFQIDQLKEIMNIGASHASTALSQMIEQKVGLTIPYAHIDTIDNIDKYFLNSDEKISTALVKVFGDINGLMCFLFSYQDERKLIDLLLFYIRDKKIKKQLEGSVIEEVGNILAGASLAAFSKFLDLNLFHSISRILSGTLLNIVKSVGTEVVGEKGLVLLFQIDFSVKSDEEISTNFMFFMDTKAIETLLAALKLKY